MPLFSDWPSSPPNGPARAWSRYGTASRASHHFTEPKPVKKFTDPKAAVARIWAGGSASVPRRCAEGERRGAGQAGGEESPRQARKRRAGAKGREGAKTSGEERSNKEAEVIAMMKRAKGATLGEIMEATGWQKHTVRGFVSILGSKGCEKVESSKNMARERMYRIAK